MPFVNITAYQGVPKRPQTYSFHIENLTAAASVSDSMTVKEGVSFIMTSLDALCHKTGDHATPAYCNILLKDMAFGRNMFDRKLPIELIAGSAIRESPWVLPYGFKGNASIVLEVTSVEAANALDLYLILLGFHTEQILDQPDR